MLDQSHTLSNTGISFKSYETLWRIKLRNCVKKMPSTHWSLIIKDELKHLTLPLILWSLGCCCHVATCEMETMTLCSRELLSWVPGRAPGLRSDDTAATGHEAPSGASCPRPSTLASVSIDWTPVTSQLSTYQQFTDQRLNSWICSNKQVWEFYLLISQLFCISFCLSLTLSKQLVGNLNRFGWRESCVESLPHNE